MTTADGKIYVTHGGGHRSSYLRVLGSELGLAPYIRKPGLSTLRTLLAAQKLLFATMEDSLLFFAIVALMRDVMQRSTTAIFMNPRTFFEPGGWRTRLKRLLARFLNGRRRITMISILPHAIDPRYMQVSRAWIYDPELWDLGDVFAPASLPPATLDAALEIVGIAPYLLLTGRISGYKGFGFFIEGMRQAEARGSTLKFVAAGPIDSECLAAAEAFRQAGGILIARFLTDDEFFALQRGAACLWACYRPDYNSSSGIFGRALQLDKRVIVNRGTYLDALASLLGFAALRCRYGDQADLQPILDELAAPSTPRHGPPTATGSLRVFSLTTLRAAISA
ncbi:MAG: hypothetical protein V4459_09270 [Pseudomonadota bacterium]